MKKLLYSLVFVSVFCYAESFDEAPSNIADCLILQDENSIICKYEHERLEEDVSIDVQWVDPLGNISRERNMIIPAGHGSVYDFRYIEGRMKGKWEFRVKEGELETITNFIVE